MATGDGPFCRICGQYGHHENIHGSLNPTSPMLDDRPIEEKIQEIMAEVPEAEWDRVQREDELKRITDSFYRKILSLLNDQNPDIPRDRVKNLVDAAEDLLSECEAFLYLVQTKSFKSMKRQVKWFRKNVIHHETPQPKRRKKQ